MVGLVAEDEGAEHEGVIALAGVILDERVGRRVLEKSARGGGLGPEDELRLHGQRAFGQTRERVINTLLEGGIPFFVLRDGRLDRGDAQAVGFHGGCELT